MIFVALFITCHLFLELTERDVPGFAIGGLSGGEEKGQFWRMVTLSTDHLPRQKPRYLMGVGFVSSAVYCTALSHRSRFGLILVLQSGVDL